MPVRSPLALLALALLPAPAHAQDAARVTDVVESSDGFSCRAKDLPELLITHDWRDADRHASWEVPAREAGGNDIRIRATFTPDPDQPYGTAAALVGFQLDLDRAPLKAAPADAHLRVDGKPEPVVLEVDGSRTSVAVGVIERQRADLAAHLMRASIVELDLVDASAAPLGRFSWDVRALRRAPPLLQVINWSCR